MKPETKLWKELKIAVACQDWERVCQAVNAIDKAEGRQ